MTYHEQQMKKRIGEILTEARSAADLSRNALAEKTGVSVRTLLNFEQGISFPQGQNLHKIAEALGWDTHRITRLFASDKDPAEVNLSDLSDGGWDPRRVRSASDLSDEELLAELTFRFQQRNHELAALKAPKNNVTPLRPAFDESTPHAAHPPLRLETSQYDDLGEDPQD